MLEDNIKEKIKRIFAWTITLCRIALGLVVIKVGFDFARGGGAFSYQETDTITGIFVMIIGASFVFSSLLRDLFDRSE